MAAWPVGWLCMVKLSWANAPAINLGLGVAFGRLSRGVHGPGYCTQHLSLFALVRVYEIPCSRFLLQPDNTFYLPGNTFYLPGRHFMVIAHALESTVIHKLHARVFNYRPM